MSQAYGIIFLRVLPFRYSVPISTELLFGTPYSTLD